jgi:hypothetical protein
MKTPHEKYRNDPQYKAFVDILTNLIIECKLTPSEVREAAVLACIHNEMMFVQKRFIIPKEDGGDIEKALKTMETFRLSESQ